MPNKIVNGRYFGLEKNGKIVGAILLESYNGAMFSFHVCGDYFNRKFLKSVYDYCFNTAKVNILLGFVDSNNKKASKFAKRNGFIVKSTIKDGVIGGNLLIYTMNYKQCKFIGD